jgi:hypothetical protein
MINDNIAISETGFIFHPETGESFSVNEQGREIFHLLKENKSYQEIRDFMLGRYDVDEATFEKDYQDFINLLENYQIATSHHGQTED